MSACSQRVEANTLHLVRRCLQVNNKDSPKVRSLDVRPLIARGEDPRDKILTAIATLAAGESHALVTPFLPSPLIERLQADGFSARPERRADGSWQTLFSRD